MDDLLLFTPDKKSHKAKLEDSPKAFLKNKLLIKGRKVCIKPIRKKIEAIQILKPPTTPKDAEV